MTCALGPGGSGVGVACGGCCTPDGVNTVCGDPGTGGCPVLPPSGGGGGTGHAVSGTITGTVVSGVTLLLSDQATHLYSATSGPTGSFQLTGVADGSYTLVPTLASTLFEPPFRSVTVAGADVAGQDFVSSALPTFTVSGHVTDFTTGAATPGVTVQLTPSGGSPLTTVTDAAGAYSFTGLPANAYTITPSLAGYAFSPPTLTFGLAADITTMDFTAAVQAAGTHAISGTITGPVVVGVQVSILGPGADTAMNTGVDGAWFFPGLPDGTYDITPYYPGFVFTPTTRQVQLAGADVGGQDFALHLPVLSGHVTVGAGGPALPGVTIQLTDGVSTNLNATTDATGFYTFGGLPQASYTLTPSLAGYAFTPSSVPVGLFSDTTVDFTAQ
jgi:inhibitor of cysteine peptidase